MATVKHREWVEMERLKDQLDRQQQEVAALREDLKNETQRRSCAERDLKFVAKFFCRFSDGFSDWLLDQDLSSAHARKPSGRVGVEVEGKSDVDLAIEFCKWIDRQGQNPTS